MKHSICRTITIITFFLIVVPSNLYAQTDEYTAYDKAKFISDIGLELLNKAINKSIGRVNFRDDSTKLNDITNFLKSSNYVIKDYKSIDVPLIKKCMAEYNQSLLNELATVTINKKLIFNEISLFSKKISLEQDSSKREMLNARLQIVLDSISTTLLKDNITKNEAPEKNKEAITTNEKNIRIINDINLIGRLESPKEFSLNNKSFGASIQTQIIEGLTLFIVDRTKQELTLQYLKKLRDITQQSELKPLFTNTLLMLNSLEQNTLPTMGTIWKTALFLDLKSMPDSLLKMVLRNEKLDKKTIKNIKMGLQVFEMYKGLQKGAHPIEIINSICDSIIKEDNSLNYIKTAKTISNSFYSTENGKWVSLKEINDLGQEGIKIFASLYLRQVADEPTYKNSLSKLSSEITRIKGFVRQFNAVQSKINDLSENESFGDSLYSKSYGKYLFLYSDILKTVIKESGIYSKSKNDLEALEGLFNNIDSFADITDALNKQQFGRVSFLLYAYSTKVNKEKPVLPPKFMKIASFVSDISEAKTSEDVKSIIEAAAVPVGEWREKRTNVNYIYLQSYLGIGFGREIFQNQIPGFYTGLQAPVGIEFQNSCFRLFISLLDLGAVANYHVSFADNDSVKSIPEVGFAQVVSPGLFFIHHLEDNPITWGKGFSFSPQLREIKNSNAVLRDGFLNSYKVGAFLAVDIPIWRLN